MIFGTKAQAEKITNLESEIDSLILQLKYSRENRSEHTLEVAELENTIKDMKQTQKDEIARGIAQEKRDLKSTKETQEREHKALVKKLEAEHLEKISRVDRKLEEDKTSFRKYLKTEFNTRLEKLEKENQKLSDENAEVRGINVGLESVNGHLSGQAESTLEVLSQFVKALPSVSATITTPESHVHVEPARGGNGGGNK